MGLAISAAYLVTQRVSRPLNRLIDGVDKIRFGQAIKRLPSDSVTEFNAVSEAFNEMSDNLEKINKNRRFILASVSHDIRTPLTRLRLASEMLPEKLKETKSSMEQDISEINEIINQFLDFARGFEDEPITSVNLGQLLKETQLKHQRAGHTFKLIKTNKKADIPKKLFVDLRVMAFKRCLDNLINNAFFYTKGEVKVEVTLYEESFSISIIDQGPGIPEKEKKRLLEPFERVDTARGNKGGAGLGLSIADQIAKAHWGKLELINIKKGGLEVKLTIPLNLG